MLFDSEDLLKSHSREEENRCKVQPTELLDGITPETERLLRSRKKEYKGQTEPELWKKMYRVLFPNEIVPSPCKLGPFYLYGYPASLFLIHFYTTHSGLNYTQRLTKFIKTTKRFGKITPVIQTFENAKTTMRTAVANCPVS
jgi:hypothetical protein